MSTNRGPASIAFPGNWRGAVNRHEITEESGPTEQTEHIGPDPVKQ